MVGLQQNNTILADNLYFYMCRVILVLMMSVGLQPIFAQNIDYGNWMSRLPNERRLSELSIPGAHDAASAGLHAPWGLGRTQVLSIEQQWAHGIRAFDFRPAVRDTTLHIYHSVFKTNLTFHDALQKLTGLLRDHPREFVIVVLREEAEAENAKERQLWSEKVGASIAALGDTAAQFHQNMTVGQLRGKILFISRNNYTIAEAGAQIKGWNHSAEGTRHATIVCPTGSNVMRLQLQDFYATTSRKKREAKRQAIRETLQWAATAPDTVITINFLSGYSSTLLGIPSIATTAGYKRNAVDTHHEAMLWMNENRHAKQPLGIVFLDFVGYDTLRGTWTHPRRFVTNTRQLVQRIVNWNM